MKEKPYYWREIWSDKEFRENLNLLFLSLPSSIIFKEIKRFVNRKKEKIKVVEVGCGSGLFTLYISKKLKLYPILLDVSPHALFLTKSNAKRLNVKAKVKYGDIRNLPLPSYFSEIVLSVGVNEHFIKRERTRTFEEMIRITKKGGIILIQVPNSYGMFYRLGMFVRKIIGKWNLLEIPYSKYEVKRILNNLEKKYNIQFHIFASGFLQSLCWLIPGRFRLIKKISTLLANVHLPLLDELGGSLTIIINKR